MKEYIKLAKRKKKTIVFPEAGFSDRIINAALYLFKKKIANVLLVGDESALVLRYKNAIKGLTIINPKTSDITLELAQVLYEKRKHKGITIEECNELVLDPIYFGTLLVETGFADCMVAGAETSSSKVIKAALQVVGAKEEWGFVSSFMLIQGKNNYMPKEGKLLLSDIGLCINPTLEETVILAKQTAETAKLLNIEPRMAFLSYSTNGSAKGEAAEKMREAAKQLREAGYLADGEIQLDAALVPEVAKLKMPGGALKGNANILIFPDLASGNITYKAIERFGSLKAYGPFLQGLNKPISDLSRGASVHEIIATCVLTILLA